MRSETTARNQGLSVLLVCLCGLEALITGGCSEPGVEAETDAAASPDAMLDGLSDAGVGTEGYFDADTWEALLAHSPSRLPSTPMDLSNRVADDAVAAALGQALFFDPGFSGTLLDSDNDGAHNGEGLQGEAGKVSCASCHVAEDGFSDTRTVFRQISLGSGWTARHTPSILDVGHASLLMWDGRFDSLQRQVLGVIESPVEANSSRLFFAQEIARRYSAEYQEVFGSDPSTVLSADFPQLTPETTGCQLTLTSTTTPDDDCSEGTLHGVPGDGAEFDSLSLEQQRLVTTIALNGGRAIAAFERRLSCGQSRFDAFMQGDAEALSDSERRGAALFVGPGKCAECHSGPFFSDQAFHNVGLVPEAVAVAFVDENDEGAERGLVQAIEDPLNVRGEYSDGDDGRLPETVPASMRGAFRTPMLRCVASRPSFMHTGQLRELSAVVEHFNNGGDIRPEEGEQLGFLGVSEIAPLGLTETEVADIVAFLGALDGPGPDASFLSAP